MADRQQRSIHLAVGNASLWYERVGQVVAFKRNNYMGETRNDLARAKVLRDQLANALKDASEAGSERAVCTLRLVLTAINERDFCARESGHSGGISEDAIQAMLKDMVAQRRIEIGRCESGARLDLAEQEEQEIAILQQFLPAPLSQAETEAAVDAAIAGQGATKLKDMGPVLATLKERYNGQMDVSLAKQMLCDRLC